MTQPEASVASDLVLAITTTDGVMVRSGGDGRSISNGDQQSLIDFIGSDRVVFCDDALALVTSLAGEAPGRADPIWTVLESCRIFDVRAADLALRSFHALRPQARSYNEIARGSSTAGADAIDRLRSTVENLFSWLPTDRAEELTDLSRWPYGLFGIGHATRVHVAIAVAETRSEARLSPDLPRYAAKQPSLSSSIPNSGETGRVDRFLTDRFDALVDEAGVRFARPADEHGLLSRDLRDWGTLADADPLLWEARTAWAEQHLGPSPAIAGTRPAGMMPRMRRDLGGLRRRLAPMFRPRDGEALLRVRLTHLLCRCHLAICSRRSEPVPEWFISSPGETEGPAGAILDGIDEPIPALADIGLTRENRLQLVERILESLVSGFGEPTAFAYIRGSVPAAADLSAASLADIRRGVSEYAWFKLEQYTDHQLGIRLLELTGATGPADVVGLGFKLTGGLRGTDGLARQFGSRAKELIFGTHADVPRSDDDLWMRLNKIAAEADLTGQNNPLLDLEARDRLAVREKLSERPVGLTGRCGPAVPFWQAAAVETPLAAEEVRGVVAFALVSYG